MYWNSNTITPFSPFCRLIETWDVLKFPPCIYKQSRKIWLIETWDVLKFWYVNSRLNAYRINRNMRCIEMLGIHVEIRKKLWINRNMRCIEIWCGWFAWSNNKRLIETWDVLKSEIDLAEFTQEERLIETWDVLKSSNCTWRRIRLYD